MSPVRTLGLDPPDNFLYVFKTAPRGPMRAATEGRAATPSLRFAPVQAAALGLARTRLRVPPGDNGTRHQRTAPREAVGVAGYQVGWLTRTAD
jgi:hypothetical protein